MVIEDSTEGNGGYAAPTIIAKNLPLTKIKNLKSEQLAKISAFAGSVTARPTKRSGLTAYETKASDNTGSIKLIWFNKKSLLYSNLSREFVFLGKVQKRGNMLSMVDPVFTSADDYQKWVKRLGKG